MQFQKIKFCYLVLELFSQLMFYKMLNVIIQCSVDLILYDVEIVQMLTNLVENSE